MEVETIDTILKLVDAFISLGVLGLFVMFFMQGKIIPRSVVEGERQRDNSSDEQMQQLYERLVEEQKHRIITLEAQLQEKNKQIAASLSLMQAFQGTQDMAARTAKVLLEGTAT